MTENKRFTVDDKTLNRFIADYWDYKLHYEGDLLNKLDKEYRCLR